MTSTPSPAARNGRTQLGRFTVGNKFGTGDPHRSRVQRLRASMLSCVTEKDIKIVTLTLISMAQAGDLRAVKLLFDLIGRPEGDTPAAAPEINESNFQEVKNAWLARTN